MHEAGEDLVCGKDTLNIEIGCHPVDPKQHTRIDPADK